MPQVQKHSPRKFFRVRFPRFAKIHIAREAEDEVFKTLCGRKLPCSSTFAVSITAYHGDECLRCQRCTSKKLYKRWKGWVTYIRLQKRGVTDQPPSAV
jgi:DNA-directed RNA polymerase subunit RPC12/RpoP